MDDTLTMPQPLPATGIKHPTEKNWPWGPIQAIHRIGHYYVIEYLDDKSRSFQRQYWHEHGRTLFSAHIDGKKTSRSYTSLASAIVGAVAIDRDGENTRADSYFDRMTLNGTPW
jgi:hypothetical protein